MNNYKIIDTSKDRIRDYLQLQHFNEDIIFPILNGYKSDKYNFEGILHTKAIILLRLRFGQPNGIDVWRILDDKHLKQILDAIYYDKSLCEWIRII